MATLKLKKSPVATAASPDGPEPTRRRPVRGRGAQPRPTLAQAQAARERARAEFNPPPEPWTSAAPPRDRSAPPRDAPRNSRPDRQPHMSPPNPARAGTSTGPKSGPRPDRPQRQHGTASPDRQPSTEGPRLSKRISELGLASRREADEWIEHGWVQVNGKVIDQLGARVSPNDLIDIDPQARQHQAQRVTIVLHKPIGYVSAQAEDGHPPAIQLIDAAHHWQGDGSKVHFNRAHLKHLAPAGRLDIDSTGLLVLTQDGRIAKHLIGQDSRVEKEYLVRVIWPEHAQVESLAALFPPDRLALLRHGLSLDGAALKPAKVSWQNEQQLRFVLREGKKRQIRRMCELVGLKVVGLKRVRMGRVVLGTLPVGQWRYLGPHEVF